MKRLKLKKTGEFVYGIPDKNDNYYRVIIPPNTGLQMVRTDNLEIVHESAKVKLGHLMRDERDEK